MAVLLEAVEPEGIQKKDLAERRELLRQCHQLLLPFTILQNIYFEVRLLSKEAVEPQAVEAVALVVAVEEAVQEVA